MLRSLSIIKNAVPKIRIGTIDESARSFRWEYPAFQETPDAVRVKVFQTPDAISPFLRRQDRLPIGGQSILYPILNYEAVVRSSFFFEIKIILATFLE
jgi:hypothetical protein